MKNNIATVLAIFMMVSCGTRTETASTTADRYNPEGGGWKEIALFNFKACK